MAFSLRSSRLASVGLASIIAVGIIGAGTVAFADEPGDGGAAVDHHGEHHPIKVGLHSLLKDSGVTREEMKEGAAAGLTLGTIIDQYGDISAAEAKANALATLDAKLADAVAAGIISQERADTIEANAPALLDRLLATVPGEHRDGRQGGRAFKIAKHSLETAAEVLGIEPGALREQLAGGQTIAEIAGPQTQAVIDALISEANAAIDNAVANGNLPADKSEAAKERAAAAIEKFVNEGKPHDGDDGARFGARRGANRQ